MSDTDTSTTQPALFSWDEFACEQLRRKGITCRNCTTDTEENDR